MAEDESLLKHFEEMQDDIRKIEKQFIIKKDLDQLKRNIHLLHDKGSKLKLKSLISKPKLLELVKKNSTQKKRSKELYVEFDGDNKFKFKSIKEKKKKVVEIEAE
tara:strand:- start:1000 stop:1314 length:315 start_codon:yes stop_codon:yes gene_type:complete